MRIAIPQRRLFPTGVVIRITLVFFLIISVVLPGFAEETVMLEMWSHWGGETMKMKFIEETITTFEKLHSNIKIKLHWIPKSRIFQSLQTSLPKGLGPDIFYADLSYSAHIENWVKKDYLLDLKDKLDWSRFEPSSYEGLWEYGEGGIYGIPIELAEYAIYYNKGDFADAGISVPKVGKFS